MRLLVDAQLPLRLAVLLKSLGHEVIHTSDLPDGNRTSDEALARVAETDGWIVVTKDHDFLDSHLLSGRPPQLLLVSTGNITNQDLLQLFTSGAVQISEAFEFSVFVELTRDSLVVHR